MNLSPVIVILIAAFTCIAAIVAWVVISERLDRPRTGRHDPFADPADRTDPHGDNWPPPADPDDSFWAQHAPAPPRAEMLTGPGTRIRQTSEVTASVLARGTGQFPMLPPDPGPDVTLIQPADVIYLGKPSGEYVDDLFEKHAGGEAATP